MPRTTRAAARAQEFQIAQDMINNSDREVSPPADNLSTSSAPTKPTLGEIDVNSINLSDAVAGAAMGDKQSVSASKGKRFKNALKGIFTGNGDGQKDKAKDSQEDPKEGDRSVPDTPAQDKYSLLPHSRDSAVSIPEHIPVFDQYLSNSLPGSSESIDNRSSLAKSFESVPLATTASALYPECFELPAEPLVESATHSLAPIRTSQIVPESEDTDVIENTHGAELVSPLTPSEGSFAGSVNVVSPDKQVETPEEVALPTNIQDTTPAKVPERTQSKSPPRIEDSVDAIDALEEALELVAKQIPDLNDRDLESPIKFKHDIPENSAATQVESASTSQKSKVSASSSFTSSNGKSASRPMVRKSSSQDQSKPALTFSTSPVRTNSKSSNSSKPRQSLSTSKAPFVPAKSNKAPTRPTFTLPGEAVSAKLKVQREERLRKEAEAEAERRKFKARPVPRVSMSSGMPVRENIASKARQSLLINNVDELSKENDPSQISGRPTSSDINIKKRQSSTTLARSSSTMRSHTSANRCRPSSTVVASTGRETSLLKTRSASDNRPTTSSTSSSNLAASANAAAPSAALGKAAITKSDIIAQRAKAKEIYGRDKIMKEEMDAAKREKEEAAKRARVEAAERSRQASREWAEKQRLKKIAASTSMTIGVSS